ncbi:hypothetical protein HDU88_000096 [Geranomyces variabilis]|nr:hypothetical protein HDU88_000096 [Geranomyces variabilis]
MESRPVGKESRTSKTVVAQVIGNTVALKDLSLQVHFEFMQKLGRSERAPVHKDFEKAPAEAAFELSKIQPYLLPDEIAMPVALVGGTYAEFAVLAPQLLADAQVIWTLDRRGKVTIFS